MNRQLEMYGAGSHVTEVYSPPRVTAWAEKMRMVPGLALDLTCVDPDDGQPWDFNDPAQRKKAEALIDEQKAAIAHRLTHVNRLLEHPEPQQDEEGPCGNREGIRKGECAP